MASSLTVGTNPIPWVAPWDGSVVNLGSNVVYIDTVNPNPATSVGISPGGAVAVQAGKKYYLMSLVGGNIVSLTEGITGVVGAVNINGNVPVQNAPSSVLSTFVKSPPALNTVSSSYGSATYSAGTYNVTPSGNIGNLCIVPIDVLIYSPVTSATSFTVSLNLSAPSGWNIAGPSSVTFSGVQAGQYTYVNFLTYGILNPSNATIKVAPSVTGGLTLSGVSYLYAVAGSGGNNSFSNPSLSGALGDSITWGSSGMSDPNLSLPSATPGLFIGSIPLAAASPSYSIGNEYVGNSAAAYPALWIATNQTGVLSVQATANPIYPSLATAGAAGLVIPQ